MNTAINNELKTTWATMEQFLDCTPKEKEMLKSMMAQLVRNTVIETSREVANTLTQLSSSVSL